MAWIKVKSSVTNKIDMITEEAYNNFYKDMGIFTVINEDDNPMPKKSQKESETTDEEKSEISKVQPIKPIKPLKAKADSKDISEEI